MEISYAPLTDDGIYTKDSDAVYPVVDVQAPLHVVSEVRAADGIGGVYASTYKYAGAKVNVDGRGFLGFRRHVAKDPQTGITQTTDFRQGFPFTGMVASQTKKLGSQLLNSLSNTWGQIVLPGGRRIPTLSSSVEANFDLDGSAIPPVTTAYEYDNFGNPTEIVISTPDGATKTTVNTYTNDIVNWHLGRLTDATVTSTVP